MKISSESFQHGHRIPPEFALGAQDGFGGNRNPQLAWRDAPGATRSFALLCIDTDAPTDAKQAKGGADLPADMPRTEFVHWAMVDIPADVRDIAAGSCSDGVEAGGKTAPRGPHGSRQGLNDYTQWFSGDDKMQGDYLGYDGPYPPPTDLRVHRYFFRVFALDVERLDVEDRFTAADVFRAMHGHVLGEASTYGIYTLNLQVQAADSDT